MLFNLLKLIGNCNYKGMTFDEVPDKIHEDIEYNKPYITSAAGCMTLYLNFPQDKFSIHVFEFPCDNPEIMSQKIFCIAA